MAAAAMAGVIGALALFLLSGALFVGVGIYLAIDWLRSNL